MRNIYLDYTADTPVNPEVLDYFCFVEKEYGGNPNSHHQNGLKAKEYLEQSQNNLRQLLNIEDRDIIYTSGASESNNLAIKGYAQRKRHFGKHILTNPLEHPSVSAPLTFLKDTGYDVEMLKVNKDGKIDINDLKNKLRDDTILVTVMAVDSELGVIQPIEEIQETLKDYPNCALLTDATQAIGKIDINLNIADMYSCSAHKFYGLKGSGLLIKGKDIVMEPLIHGGTSTSIYRSGTPAVSLNCSIEKALELSLQDLDRNYAYVKSLNETLREFYSQYSNVEINSPVDSIPHILNISVKGINGNKMQELLNDKGVCVSVKTACSVEGMPSRAVMSMYNDRKRALESFRISLSHLTSKEEINEFENIFDQVIKNVS